jgi:hypothetical protein
VVSGPSVVSVGHVASTVQKKHNDGQTYKKEHNDGLTFIPNRDPDKPKMFSSGFPDGIFRSGFGMVLVGSKP